MRIWVWCRRARKNVGTIARPVDVSKGVKAQIALDFFLMWGRQVCKKAWKLALFEAWLKVWRRAQVEREGRSTFISTLSIGGYK